MRSVVLFAATVAALTALSACASKPSSDATLSAPAIASTSPARPYGPIPGSSEDFRVSVGDRLSFDYDQYSLRPDARATIEKQAAWLKRYSSVRLLVDGNADERGTREYNLALGARRAAATTDYLVNLGVAAGRLETVSYGKERPIDPRSNEQAHALNRNAHSGIVSGAIS